MNPAVSMLTKRFDDVIAVDEVDLDIADGEYFALLGPSGYGKTTTLRRIAGLEIPSGGHLDILGDEVGTLPPNERPVNTVFQNDALFPHASVADNVAFGLKMQKAPRLTSTAASTRRSGSSGSGRENRPVPP
jgi:ABC-type Fe3+/spermidine/putrescine transport system ATPase subunit